jgi:hypothetical protein
MHCSEAVLELYLLLTKGSDLLTYQENITSFKHAFKYIKDSKRFTIV